MHSFFSNLGILASEILQHYHLNTCLDDRMGRLPDEILLERSHADLGNNETGR